MQAVEGMRKSLTVPVDDDVDVALVEQFDILGAMAPCTFEAQSLDQLDQRGGVFVARREFDEFDALHLGRRRQRRQIGKRRLASACAPGVDRLAQRAQRTHAVERNRIGRRAAELIVEDFQRDRSAIACPGDRLEIVGDGVVALAGIAAVMAAERKRVHLQGGRVGDLHQRNLLGWYGAHRLKRIAAHAGMETVEHDAEIGPIGGLHQIPGRCPVAHMPPPGQSLVADGKAVAARPVGELGKIGGGAVRIVDRLFRNIGA